MITLIVILNTGECHSLTTNLEGLELFEVMKNIKNHHLVHEVR